ncbi:MAG: arginine--tRNA ligase [Solirubrobacteraceae bacterium]
MVTEAPRDPDPAIDLAVRVVEAVQAVAGQAITREQAQVRESAPQHGADYQSNVAMGLAKRVGMNPRELAGALAERLERGDMWEAPEVAGPGFINMRLRADWMAARLAALHGDPRMGVAQVPHPERVVIDYSSPNVAKEMHVGHLRSTIIGDAIARLLRFVGHEVIPQNHVGDWGTPFGMLIEQMVGEGWDREGEGRPGHHSDGGGQRAIDDLNEFYRAAQARFAAEEQFAQAARRRVVSLQGGDPETLELWRGLVAESERHFEQIYELLGVLLRARDTAGESAYQPQLQGVADELAERGLAVESDGALCVFPAGFEGRDGRPVPVIVRKSDGGYSYDATDLAALRHRVREMHAARLLYVVGAPQRLHFEMVFAVAREAGWLGSRATAQHVAFGSVLGSDHKMLRTRSGDPVRLLDLLSEAVQRAEAALRERGMDGGEVLARQIGIGAVKYADLSGDRERDYVFSWERMLAFDGNTSVYVQYANARARAVIRRAAQDPVPAGGRGDAAGAAPGVPQEAPIVLREAPERALALTLLRFPAAIAAALDDYRPHRLCAYLYELAVAFSVFYEGCPVLGAEGSLRASRLVLCELTSATLTVGLDQLGIEAPERLSPPPARDRA